MVTRAELRAGSVVMMKSGDLALITKVINGEKYLGGKLSYIEIMYGGSGRPLDRCSVMRVEEIICG